MRAFLAGAVFGASFVIGAYLGAVYLAFAEHERECDRDIRHYHPLGSHEISFGQWYEGL